MIGRLARRPGTPRVFRALLIGYVIRNVVSVALFGYAAYLAYLSGGRLRYAMGVIALAFTAFAFYNGRKIMGQYRRSVQRAAHDAARVSGPSEVQG